MRTVIAALGLGLFIVGCERVEPNQDPWRRRPGEDRPGLVGDPFGSSTGAEPKAPPDELPPDESPPDETPPDDTPPDEAPPDDAPPEESPPEETPPEEPPPDEPPAHCANGPLELPIEGCAPSVPASSGDPHQDCVDRINQFRAECQCLPPLQRWTGGEECANRMAEADHDSGNAHGAANSGLCQWGSGQNECPGWPSVDSVVDGCLQMMWDEGPGANFWAHGHYLHMSSTEKTHVACGFHDGANGTWAVQNFY